MTDAERRKVIEALERSIAETKLMAREEAIVKMIEYGHLDADGRSVYVDTPPSPKPLPTTEGVTQAKRVRVTFEGDLVETGIFKTVQLYFGDGSVGDTISPYLLRYAKVEPISEGVTQGWQPIEKAKIGIDCIAAKIKDGVIIEAHKAHLTPEGKWAIHGFPARFYGPTHWMHIPALSIQVRNDQ